MDCRFSKEAMSSRDPLSFLPFGYGPRNCLGRRLAQLEFQCVIASLLLKYRFDTVEKTSVGHLQVLGPRGGDWRYPGIGNSGLLCLALVVHLR